MRKNRLLIIGCGDVLQRALPWLLSRFRVYAITRSSESAKKLRAKGVVPIVADLDNPTSLNRLAGLANYVLHGAPPPPSGSTDSRTRHLLAILRRSTILPCGFGYISTSGLYGNCDGRLINETAAQRPESGRAVRRLDAEKQLRRFGRTGSRVSILRAPGIYAAERLPLDRIRAATPVLCAREDSYSNHIHADDLAKTAALSLFRGQPQRTYNVCDFSEWKMGDWFDRIADAHHLPRPPRLPRAALIQQISPTLWSFMRESRRLDNGRMVKELRIRLVYPTPATLLDDINA